MCIFDLLVQYDTGSAATEERIHGKGKAGPARGQPTNK